MAIGFDCEVFETQTRVLSTIEPKVGGPQKIKIVSSFSNIIFNRDGQLSLTIAKDANFVIHYIFEDENNSRYNLCTY